MMLHDAELGHRLNAAVAGIMHNRMHIVARCCGCSAVT